MQTNPESGWILLMELMKGAMKFKHTVVENVVLAQVPEKLVPVQVFRWPDVVWQNQASWTINFVKLKTTYFHGSRLDCFDRCCMADGQGKSSHSDSFKNEVGKHGYVKFLQTKGWTE